MTEIREESESYKGQLQQARLAALDKAVDELRGRKHDPEAWLEAARGASQARRCDHCASLWDRAVRAIRQAFPALH